MRAMARRQRSGFTLIEMLIVIIVIATLAIIVIPRLLGTGRKAKEAALRGQLQQVRKAIEQFEADCGDYPSELPQLMTRPADGAGGGNGISLDTLAWAGPYLRTTDGNLPGDPLTGSNTTWTYTPAGGRVASGSTLSSMSGEPYTDW